MPFFSGMKSRRKSNAARESSQTGSQQERRPSTSTSSQVSMRSNSASSVRQASNQSTTHDTSTRLCASPPSDEVLQSLHPLPSRDSSREEDRSNATPFPRSTSAYFSNGADPLAMVSSRLSSHSLDSNNAEVNTPPMSTGPSPSASPSIPQTPPLQSQRVVRPRLVGPAPSEGYEEVPRPQMNRFGAILPATYELRQTAGRITMPCLAYGTAHALLAGEDYAKPPPYDSVIHRPYNMVFNHAPTGTNQGEPT